MLNIVYAPYNINYRPIEPGEECYGVAYIFDGLPKTVEGTYSSIRSDMEYYRPQFETRAKNALLVERDDLFEKLIGVDFQYVDGSVTGIGTFAGAGFPYVGPYGGMVLTEVTDKELIFSSGHRLRYNRPRAVTLTPELLDRYQ